MKPFRSFDVSAWVSWKMTPSHLFQTQLPAFPPTSLEGCRFGKLSPFPLATLPGLILVDKEVFLTKNHMTVEIFAVSVKLELRLSLQEWKPSSHLLAQINSAMV